MSRHDFSARTLKKKTCFDVDIVVNNKSKCDLALSVLLSETIHVITVIKTRGLTRRSRVSSPHGLLVHNISTTVMTRTRETKVFLCVTVTVAKIINCIMDKYLLYQIYYILFPFEYRRKSSEYLYSRSYINSSKIREWLSTTEKKNIKANKL